MNSPYMGNFKVTQQYKGAAHDGLDLVGLDSKEIHSTVNGIVEVAGWENSANKSQGFGQYVRIKKDGSNDRYYFGHLSEIKTRAGDRVTITQVIGIEGNTGNSTGSHCHYCIRTNSDRNKYKDVSAISGIPNALGTYDDGYRPSVSPPTPSPEPEPLAVGDAVRMANGAPIYGTNQKFATFVYGCTLYVREIYGDRIVVSTVKSGPVTGAVDRKYLTKV